MKRCLWFLLFPLLLACCNSNRDFPPVTNIASLKVTEIVPTLNSKIDNQKNQLYCSTLLFAWNELRQGGSGKIAVNKKSEQLNLINNATGFENSLSENELKNNVSINDQEIIACSEFKKSLPFKLEFERNNYALQFENQTIESFGTNGANPGLNAQFQILYYLNEKAFGVKLKPENGDHEILLLRSPKIKGKSLEEMLPAASGILKKHDSSKMKKKNAWRWQFTENDILSLPVLRFNIEKIYGDLLGQEVTLNDNKLSIEKLSQRIALVLDHKGAEIESKTAIEVVTEEEEELPKPKKLVFDKPFLLIFKKKNSDSPYFVAWIANNELMKKK